MSKIAVIEAGGKQHIVTNGTVLTVEKIIPDEDGRIFFDKVLLVDDGTETKIGTPHLIGAKVSAELIKEIKGDKVTVIRYRQKSRYFKKKGHRQRMSKVRIIALP